MKNKWEKWENQESGRETSGKKWKEFVFFYFRNY